MKCRLHMPCTRVPACSLQVRQLVSVSLVAAFADLADRLVKADPKRVTALANSTDLIAARLLRLRDIFPKVGTQKAEGSTFGRCDTCPGWPADLTSFCLCWLLY
jgi:hypothetical protein